MSYPKYLYHPKKGAILIESDEQEKELGAGWVDSPAGHEPIEPSAHDELIDFASEEFVDAVIAEGEKVKKKKVSKK